MHMCAKCEAAMKILININVKQMFVKFKDSMKVISRVININLNTYEYFMCNACNIGLIINAHTLNSVYNEVAFKEKSAITKENLCTKYSHLPINTCPLAKSCLLQRKISAYFFIRYRRS